jgi:hypothetical protein
MSIPKLGKADPERLPRQAGWRIDEQWPKFLHELECVLVKAWFEVTKQSVRA